VSNPQGNGGADCARPYAGLRPVDLRNLHGGPDARKNRYTSTRVDPRPPNLARATARRVS
jgi:hypothetical protein